MTRNTKNNHRFVAPAIVLFAAMSATQSAKAQTVLQFDETVDVDALGNGTFLIHMEFNAQQFQVWQQKYGTNPSLLRRDFSKMLSAYDITEFEIDKNDMERQVKLTITASGVTRNMGDGQVEMDVPKEWRLINQDGPELKFNYLEALGNGVSIQHYITVHLPEGATDVSEPFPAAGGTSRFTYQQPGTARSSTPFVLGIVLAAMGAGVTTAGFFMKRKAA